MNLSNIQYGITLHIVF